MYQALLTEAEEMLRGLFADVDFQDKDWFGFTVPEDIADDPNQIQPGYFFGEHEFNRFQKYKSMGIKALFNHPRLSGRYGFIRNGDKVVMNPVACQDFLHRAHEARTKLGSACHISLGGPPRGSEFTSNCLKNHPQGDRRNVLFINGGLCFVSGYNKTSQAVSVSLAQM
jgi:hypothetical protein